MIRDRVRVQVSEGKMNRGTDKQERNRNLGYKVEETERERERDTEPAAPSVPSLTHLNCTHFLKGKSGYKTNACLPLQTGHTTTTTNCHHIQNRQVVKPMDR